MNVSPPSQCNSSGCESGWTNYLDHSSYLSQTQFQRENGFVDYAATKLEDEEEEEDLSMVSDASSGPPHYHELDEDYLCENGSSFSVSWGCKLGKKSKKKKEGKESGREQYLDDTASSQVLNSSKNKLSSLSRDESPMQNVLDFSEGFSATHMKGKSALMQHFGFFKSSLAKNQSSQKPGPDRAKKNSTISAPFPCKPIFKGDFQGGSWE